MRRVLFITGMLIAATVLLGGRAFAQASSDRIPKIIDAHIDFKGHEVSGGLIIINYSIPFSGMVEFRLFDNEGHQLWQNQYTNTFGENRIVLRASKLVPGRSYSYEMVYKRNSLVQNLEIPGSEPE